MTGGRSGILLFAAAAVVVACAAAARGWELLAQAQIEPLLALQHEQRWDQLEGDGWSYMRRSSSKDDEIVFDHEAPYSPPAVLKIVFTPDMQRDHEPSVHWTALPNANDVYATWWVKLSPNWSASPAGGGKIAFLHGWPDGTGQVYINVGGSRSPHRINVNTEWQPYGQRVWEPNEATTPIRYGRWYRIDWRLKWPAAATGNRGVLTWWVDRTLNGHYDDVRVPPGGVGFQQFEFAPTLQVPPPDEQYMYIDHTVIRVGTDASAASIP
jgi:hypothetical protein